MYYYDRVSMKQINFQNFIQGGAILVEFWGIWVIFSNRNVLIMVPRLVSLNCVVTVRILLGKLDEEFYNFRGSLIFADIVETMDLTASVMVYSYSSLKNNAFKKKKIEIGQFLSELEQFKVLMLEVVYE